MSDNETPDFRLSAWDAIKADPQLARARQKLSAHDLRLIINHAQDAPKGKLSQAEMVEKMKLELEALEPRRSTKEENDNIQSAIVADRLAALRMEHKR